MALKKDKVVAHLLESYEHELGGVQVYTTAISAAVTPELVEEWAEYLEQTRNHVKILEDVFTALGIDKDQETPGRPIVRHCGAGLVKAIEMARAGAPPEDAEVVAGEMVTLAETKDHANWELIGEIAEASEGAQKEALTAAVEAVEDEEDEHLYHTMGWTRELHLKGLGLPAVIPPPEEEKHVKTAIGAARAKATRTELLGKKKKKKAEK